MKKNLLCPVMLLPYFFTIAMEPAHFSKSELSRSTNLHSPASLSLSPIAKVSEDTNELDSAYESKRQDSPLSSLSDYFTPEQYAAFLERIKKLDSLIYQDLVTYTENTGLPAFKKAKALKCTVLRPSDEQRNIPLMILTPHLSDNELDRYLGSYKALRKNFPKIIVEEKSDTTSESSSEEEEDASVSGSDDEDESLLFSQEEYAEYMKLIESLDADFYRILKEAETRSIYPGIVIIPANDDEDTSVSIFGSPQEYPLLIIQSLAGKSEPEKIEILKPLIAQAHKLLEKERRSRGILPARLYHQYLQLARQISEDFYNNLIACEQALGEPCLREGNTSKTLSPIEKSNWFPRIIVYRNLEHWNPEAQIEYLKTFSNSYCQAPALDQKERDIILDELALLAPDLHHELITADPTGTEHIKRDQDYDQATVSIAPDGLPLLKVGKGATSHGKAILRWTLAHELGHYFYEHQAELDCSAAHHRNLQKEDPGNEFLGLDFEETFENVLQQVQEYEADVFAITHMGISLDEALEALEDAHKDDKLPSPKKTFLSTHPQGTRSLLGGSNMQLNADIESLGRMAHTKCLEREIERLKLQGNYPRKVDWKQVIQRHRERLGLPVSAQP